MTHPDTPSAHTSSAAERAEYRWATVAVIIVVGLAVMAGVAGIRHTTMPQALIQAADPATLHLGGEFIESNLGSAAEPDGSVTVRAIGQRYSFTPQCILVPTDTPITLRATSSDVIHGILIEGTTVNTMLVPGYVSIINARFSKPGEHLMPCQEFCSIGHEGMWGKVKVIDKADFAKLAADDRRVSCVK